MENIKIEDFGNLKYIYELLSEFKFIFLPAICAGIYKLTFVVYQRSFARSALYNSI